MTREFPAASEAEQEFARRLATIDGHTLNGPAGGWISGVSVPASHAADILEAAEATGLAVTFIGRYRAWTGSRGNNVTIGLTPPDSHLLLLIVDIMINRDSFTRSQSPAWSRSTEESFVKAEAQERLARNDPSITADQFGKAAPADALVTTIAGLLADGAPQRPANPNEHLRRLVSHALDHVEHFESGAHIEKDVSPGKAMKIIARARQARSVTD